MKKIIFLCTMILLLTGCSKENLYADYEHYDLKNKEAQYYECLDDEHVKRTYAVADITPEEYESHLRGLFYQVGENDYILLDQIEYNSYEESHSRELNIIFDNELYMIGNGSSAMVTKYTLNGAEFIKEDLTFSFPDLDDYNLPSHYYPFGSFKDINLDYIYFGNETVTTRCSLEDYECEYIEN